jgi:hypothetical protein
VALVNGGVSGGSQCCGGHGGHRGQLVGPRPPQQNPNPLNPIAGGSSRLLSLSANTRRDQTHTLADNVSLKLQFLRPSTENWPRFVFSISGRGQPLSFGEIPWFDEKGEIRRCDWLEGNP